MDEISKISQGFLKWKENREKPNDNPAFDKKKLKKYILILTLLIIVNIIMLCQPVFGTYRGETMIRTSGFLVENFDTTFSFRTDYVTITYSRKTVDDVKKYQSSSIYWQEEDQIVIYDDGYLRKYTRNSVFKLASEEGTYDSPLAILTQVAFCVLDLILVCCIVSIVTKKKIMIVNKNY